MIQAAAREAEFERLILADVRADCASSALFLRRAAASIGHPPNGHFVGRLDYGTDDNMSLKRYWVHVSSSHPRGRRLRPGILWNDGYLKFTVRSRWSALGQHEPTRSAH